MTRRPIAHSAFIKQSRLGLLTYFFMLSANLDDIGVCVCVCVCVCMCVYIYL